MKPVIVDFKNLNRWDPVSIFNLKWKWDESIFMKISDVLFRYTDEIDLKKIDYEKLQFITIHFNGTIDPRNTKDKIYSMKLYKVNTGDIVLSKIDLKNGAVGICPFYKEKIVAVTSHFAAYKINKEKLLPEFFLLLIQNPHFKEYLWRNKVGAEGRKEVKLDFFEKISIPVPSLETQQKIVNFWEKSQELVVKFSQKVTELEKKKDSFIRNELGLLKQKNSKNDKIIITDFKDIERWSYDWVKNKKKLISKYPLVAYSELFISICNGNDNRKYVENGQYYYLRVSNITIKGIDFDTAKKINQRKKKGILARGDLLITRKGTVGNSAIFNKEIDTIASSEIFILKLNSQLIYPDYFVFINNSNFMKNQYLERAGGTIMPSLSQEALKKMLIPLPPLEKQIEIAESFKIIENEIDNYIQQSENEKNKAQCYLDKILLGENL